MTTAREKLEAYLIEKRCGASNPDDCLEETAYLATRGDGRKVKVEGVHRWRDKDQVQGFELPHFLLEYMRLLRNACAAEPEVYRGKLYDQVDFLVSDAVDRNGALVWENKVGIAQGMEQAEFADHFASVARIFDHIGDTKNARGIMSYALRCLRSLDMPVGEHTGGVCSGEFYCGAKRARFRPACWFHSRGRGIDTRKVHTVLNQHLHVVRDMLSMYLNVAQATDLVDPRFGTSQQVLDRIEDRAIAGLYQLAFSAGNTSVQRSRPPNIRQFMHFHEGLKVKPSEAHPDGNPLDFFWAYYEFEMPEGKGKNISHQRTCGYHTHSLNLIASIVMLLTEHAATFQATADGWRLYEAIDALLAGAGEPTGKPDSTNAVYQFYRSEAPAYKSRRLHCSEGEDLRDEAREIFESRFR